MSKKHIQFILIFLIAMILFGSVSPLTYAQTPSPPSNTNNIFLDKTFLQSVAVAILSAVLAFLGGYALAGISKKSGSGKRLSYSLNIESGLVNIDKNIKNKVRVLYENQEIVNLSNVKFDIENTGNSVVKSEEIRFEFSEGSRIIDFYFDPQPHPEMKVEKLDDSGLKDCEKKCRIGHIERNQALGVRFVVSSDSEIKLTPHPYNENGDVEFSSRSATKILNEREQVANFLSLLIMYFVIPPVFSLFDQFPFVENIVGVVRLVILLSLFRFIVPFSQVIAELISIRLNKDSQSIVFTECSLEEITVNQVQN